MKKLMKKKVNIFGKGIPVFVIALLGLAIVSAALLPYFGKITGNAIVNQGLLVDGGGYSTPIDEDFPLFTSLEAKNYASKHTLENGASVDADLKFVRTCNKSATEFCDADEINTSYQKWNTPVSVTTDGTTALVGSRPSVIYNGDHYEMWYWNGGIQMATSPQGNVWTNVETAYAGADSFFVMKEGSTYYMINYGESNQKFKIYTSNNGYIWNAENVIFTGSSTMFPSNVLGGNDYVKIDNPKILKDGSEYKMYFQVKTQKEGTADKYYIFMATSDTIGGTYTLANNGNPVLSPAENAWDDYRVMQPMVFKEDNQYIMMYMGYTQSEQSYKIGYAISDDGVDFTKVEILDDGYDTVLGTGSAKPSLVEDANGDLVLFYMNDGKVMKADLEYISADEEFTVPAGETQNFFIVNKFPKMLVPGTYTITTEVQPYTTE